MNKNKTKFIELNTCNRRLAEVQHLKEKFPETNQNKNTLIYPCIFNNMNRKQLFVFIKEILKTKPPEKIFITGCGASLFKAEKLNKQFNIPDENIIEIQDILPNTPNFYTIQNKTLIITISKGCNKNCTYCGDKIAVGNVKSTCPKAIINIIKHHKNIKKIRLMADDAGDYGADTDYINLQKLLFLIQQTNNKAQISIEEIGIKGILNIKEFLKLHSNNIKTISLAIQSVNDNILKDMKRDYNSKQAIEALQIINKNNIKVHAHIIIGFPNDTKQNIFNNCKFIVNNNINSCTFFKYEEVENTEATKLTNKLSGQEKEELMLTVKNFMLNNNYHIAEFEDKIIVRK